MSTYILTSMFRERFPAALAETLHRVIPKAARFAFVASEFELLQEKTEKYFHHFLQMFATCGIEFVESRSVDGRMTAKEAQETVRNADVVWLSGGDTPTQYGYFNKYGLVDVLRAHTGVVIGMSAGSINMAETAVCTVACGHDKPYIYPALGLVPFSVEPHLNDFGVTAEHLALSERHVLYGLCDEAAIVFENGAVSFLGSVVRIKGRAVETLSAE